MESKINDYKKPEQKNIDYSLYSSQPDKLFIISQEELLNNNFSQSIDILKNSIVLAQKKYGGDNKIELAQFYNKYADAILQKISLSSLDNINITNTKEDNDENNHNNNENKLLDEVKKVYENLSKANKILNDYLEQYNDKDPISLDKEIKKYYLYLSDNYSLLALLEKILSNFEKSIEYYSMSIYYSKKYDIKFSRNLAGLYFELAQILLYDPFNCLLSLYKSKLIMEYHLQKEIIKSNLDIKLYIDEKDLDLTILSHNSDKIYKNKDIIENNKDLINAMKENKNIEEFVDIIKDMNNKIENVILELKEYESFIKSRKQKEKEGEKNNEKNEVEDLIINMNKIKLINMKRKEPSNNDDDIKMIKEEFTKEKLLNNKVNI